MSSSSKSGAGDASTATRRLRAAAELVLGTELLPGPAPLPDFVALVTRRARWQRRSLVLGSGAALAVVGLVSVLMLREHVPISYVVDGAVAISDGVIDATGPLGGMSTEGDADGKSDDKSDGDGKSAEMSARIRFSEGTEVGLTPGARLRVVGRTERGAALALDRGRARFAVTHRTGARWSVTTGPYTVEVVGTKFSVDWSPRDQRLVVDLASGVVQVRGASVGGPVAMHPGERLIATAADRRVTLSPLGDTAGGLGLIDGGRVTKSVAAAIPVVASDASAPVVVAPSSRSAKVRRVPAHRASRKTEMALNSPSRTYARTPAFTSTEVETPVTAPAPAPAPAPLPGLEPSAVVPRPTPATGLGGGGSACASDTAQYRFERPESGISVPAYYTLAFSNPRPDHTRSWCGQTSIRADAKFNDSGRRNFFGRFPNETGQVIVKLDRPTNFTGKTLRVHFFVDGPSDARFTAELFVVHRGRWIASQPLEELGPGHWWTVSHRFDVQNMSGVSGSSNPTPFPVGAMSEVTDCNRVAIAIHSTGDRRVWTGAIYVDDVGWR